MNTSQVLLSFPWFQCIILSRQIVGVRPAPSDGRSDASNEDDVDVSQDDSAVTSKTYDADEDKYREKPK